MDSFSVSTDEKIIEIHENARKSLIRSFLTTDFLEKHNGELQKLTSKDTILLIKEIIGVDSDKKRCEKAIEKITNSTRNVKAEENFLKFSN